MEHAHREGARRQEQRVAGNKNSRHPIGAVEDTNVERICHGRGMSQKSGRLNGLSVITYLDLAFGDILGLLRRSVTCPHVGDGARVAYQIADHDLALAYQPTSLGGCLLCAIAVGLGLLLNAASGRGGSGAVADRGAAGGATLVGVAALGRENLVKTLVELAGHVGDWGDGR